MAHCYWAGHPGEEANARAMIPLPWVGAGLQALLTRLISALLIDQRLQVGAE